MPGVTFRSIILRSMKRSGDTAEDTTNQDLNTTSTVPVRWFTIWVSSLRVSLTGVGTYICRIPIYPSSHPVVASWTARGTGPVIPPLPSTSPTGCPAPSFERTR